MSSSPPDFSIVHPVPGLGKPLDYTPTKKDPLYVGKPFPTALLPSAITSAFNEPEGKKRSDKAFLPITTLREFLMLGFMNSVTDKPDWDKKAFDAEIIKKWRSETVGADDIDMTDAMFDFCIAELQHVAKNSYAKRADRALVVFNGNVVKSDYAVPESVKVALQQAVKPLEDVPENQKDWHPGSNDTVLDLVHPSLFPAIGGKSRVLKVGQKTVGLTDCVERCGQGDVLARLVKAPKANEKKGIEPYSLKFQWLPCEVDISENESKIISYINNLHPQKHTELYRVIEQVIDAALPLWESTLAPLCDKDFNWFKRISCDTVVYEDDNNEDGTDAKGDSKRANEDGMDVDSSEAGSDISKPPDAADGDAEIVDDDGDDNWEDEPEEYSDEDETPKVVVKPEPEKFDPEKYGKPPKPFSFKELYGKQGRPLQIIVKLANIELTPEKPKYEGGTWHIEGKQNEHICATAIYYYSSHNIKASHLAFRQFIDTEEANELPYEQNDHDFLKVLFGCENEEAGEQDVGKVETREGRLLTFPNILQHQVQPFELEDPSQNGHRKILALFLVDPNVRVISTACVPPQQVDWWREAVTATRNSSGSTAKGLDKLPVELKDSVFEAVDGFPITLKEAKEYREKLMEERKKFVRDHAKSLMAYNAFSLCEH
ncbi:hypothetical protein EST38_g7937 [Candolleomyces aberdarensis]|uniref:Uncharacterized protein n=1 Tax=Candolleomyces aberdarensis TaxID=2316362 RepID=A0A4Q2DDX4_9AGAR|nr:hypothetical protein EST38_g7937 [Candolleomyces aberdarensis]